MSFFGFGSKRKRPLVLVVDDDPMVADLHCDFLSSLDCDKVSTLSGKEALEVAAAGKPDLILLDMVMPVMSGLAVLRFLKQESATKKIPVIMITGEQKGSDVEAAFGLGAADYIVKPVGREQFCSKVKAVLSPPGFTFPA